MKLQRQAKTLLFDQLVRKTSMSYEKLLRFTFTSKSNASVVRRFLNGQTIIYGNKFTIVLEQLKTSFSISDEELITILELLHPQRLKLYICFFDDVPRLEHLLPYLDGVTKLTMFDADASLAYHLRRLFPQLNEIECYSKSLIVPSLPVLNLKKLKISGNIGNNPSDMWYIFRHNIKTLDMSYNDGLFIDKSNMGQASIEHLILSSLSIKRVSNLLPLVINYCDHFPKFKKLNIQGTETINSKRHPLFGNEFADICADVVSFKDQVKHLLSELIVDLSIGIHVSKEEEYRENWEIVLSRIEQFGNPSIDKQEDDDRVELTYIEKVDGMLFTLKLKVTLVVHEQLD